MRIVSLLPSATEIVCLLGLREQLVGVTHECDYPASVKELPSVTRSMLPADASSAEIDRLVSERVATETSLYALDAARLAELQPDLIVTQNLCDVCAVAESEVQAVCRRLKPTPTVVNLEPRSLDDVLSSIRQVAEAAGVADRANSIVAQLKARIDRVAKRSREMPPLRVALLEWLDPPFAAGHWNPTLVRLAGGKDVLGIEGEKSNRVTWEQIAQRDPQAIVVACCGYSAQRAEQDIKLLAQHPVWSRLAAVRNGRVHVMDGSQYFNRPGPRLVDSLEMLESALHGRPRGSSQWES